MLQRVVLMKANPTTEKKVVKTGRILLAWTLLAMILLSAGSVEATDYKPFINHYMTGTQGSWYYRTSSGRVYSYSYFDIGTDCANFTVDTGYDGHRGYGDCDLYLGYGVLPSNSRYYRRSVRLGYRERIKISNPRAGRYYVRIYGIRNYKTCFRVRKTIKIPSNWRAEMLKRVNYERRRRGRATVRTQSYAQRSSQIYARDMANKHYYGGSKHVGSTRANYTFPRRLKSAGWKRYREARENIAYGYTTVASVMRAWMKSSGHRSSLLRPGMRYAGFGLADGRDRYGFRWVQTFIDPL